MIKTNELIRWRKNAGLSIFIHISIFVVAVGLGLSFSKKEDILLLIICFGFIVLTATSLLISLFTWNRFIYLNKEKFWIVRKNKVVEWKIDDIKSCRVVRKPFWTKIFIVEIISSDNPKPLFFETNLKIEKILIQITKDKPNSDIFTSTFK